MKFKRGLDPKGSMDIGLGPEGILVNLINKALPSSEKYKNYVYDPSGTPEGTRHAWIKKYGGAYFALFKSCAIENGEGPEEFKQYFITYDTGGIDYGNLPAYDFLISMGVKI